MDRENVIRAEVKLTQIADIYDPEIVGHTILGAIHQTALEGARAGRDRLAVVRNLTQFLVRALCA